MDFKPVIKKLIARFNEKNVRYGLMGGFALGLWGVSRSTADLDFLVDRNDMATVDSIMKDLGYKCRFKSENVSQYVSDLRMFGEIDFLHAFREASREMLDRAIIKEVFSGDAEIRVLQPEDLIGLKMQAIKNDAARKENDLSDIKALIAVRGEQLDWALITKYAEILQASDILSEARRQ